MVPNQRQSKGAKNVALDGLPLFYNFLMVREGHGLSHLAQLLEILGNNNIDVFENIHKGPIYHVFGT